jgi:hypothetical protein
MTMDNGQIRAIFMAHGFTVKDGQADLKPYVYAAAQALLAAERERCVQSLVDEATRFAAMPIGECPRIGDWAEAQQKSGAWLGAAAFLRADAP